MTVIAFALLLAGWTLLYAGLKNVSLTTELRAVLRGA